MINELENRFGDNKVKSVKEISDTLRIQKVEMNFTSPVTVLMTNGLSRIDMPVHEKYKGRENVELYFCLPSYWDLEENDNPNRNWPIFWLEKLATRLETEAVWYGPGHTFQIGQLGEPLSELVQQSQLMMVDPILLKEELKPLRVGDKTIHFLALMPIYSDELEFKQAKGTNKLVEKFRMKNITEKLDDFRETVLKSRWKFWK